MQDPDRSALFVTRHPSTFGCYADLRVFRWASVARCDRAGRLADRGFSNRALANRHLANRRLFCRIDRHGLPTRQIRSVRNRRQSKRSTESKYNLLHSHIPLKVWSKHGSAVPPDTPHRRAAECVQVAAGAGHVGGICRARADVMCLNVSEMKTRLGLSFPEDARAYLLGEPNHENRSERESEVKGRPQKCIACIRHGAPPLHQRLIAGGKDSGGRDGRLAPDQFCCAAGQLAGEPFIPGSALRRPGMTERVVTAETRWTAHQCRRSRR